MSVQKNFKESLSIQPKIDKKEFILKRVKDKTVLDLGCIGHTWERSVTDPSWLHKAIVKNSRECYGIDFLKEDVLVLNQNGFNTIHHGDATDLTLNNKFEVIILGDLIEHVHDMKGLFSTFDKHLIEGGEVVITTPNPFYINHFITILVTNQIGVNPEHVFWFDPKVLSELAKRYNFKVEHVEWLVDSDRVLWSQVNKKSYKEIIFFLLFKFFSIVRLLKYIRPYYSSEFGMVLKKGK